MSRLVLRRFAVRSARRPGRGLGGGLVQLALEAEDASVGTQRVDQIRGARHRQASFASRASRTARRTYSRKGDVGMADT